MTLRTFAQAALVVAIVGCTSGPKQKPRILRSVSPPGAAQAPPLNSRQPIEVPSAPVGQPATLVQPVPLVPTAPATVVPVQPGLVPNPYPALQPQSPSAGQTAPGTLGPPTQNGASGGSSTSPTTPSTSGGTTPPR
jgi:hypothetical protein